MHVARLIAITELRNVPSDIWPFVEFKAAVEDRQLEKHVLCPYNHCLSLGEQIPIGGFLSTHEDRISRSNSSSAIGIQEKNRPADTI
jgi:hypothetical protein